MQNRYNGCSLPRARAGLWELTLLDRDCRTLPQTAERGALLRRNVECEACQADKTHSISRSHLWGKVCASQSVKLITIENPNLGAHNVPQSVWGFGLEFCGIPAAIINRNVVRLILYIECVCLARYEFNVLTEFSISAIVYLILPNTWHLKL
jgi:hypothetical protein